ncbi:MAG: hypothetical protein H6Q59_2937 [Firmicutes bacterium]|nr:hypothetical protein [Bacillota bacterium]
MNVKTMNIIKKLLVLLIGILICLALSYVIALLVSRCFHITFRTVMVYEGFLVILIGALLSPSGSRSIINLGASGQKNAAQISYQDLEVNRLEQELERKNPLYYKNFFSTLKTINYHWTFLISGAAMLLYTLEFMK